jgi:hypothetical protein
MRRSFLTGFVAVVVVMTIAACRIADPGTDPPSQEVQVTASSTPTTLRTIPLGPRETRWIRVSIPSHLRGSNQRLVVEANDDGGRRQLDLVVYDSSGSTPLASTSGIAYFEPGLSGIGGGDIGPSATRDGEVERSVSVVGRCFGPCIARRAPTGLTQTYVRLTNRSNDSYTVPFLAWAEPFIDEGEPANDTRAGAVPVSRANPYRGAIEVLGDVDYVRFTQVGRIAFSERPGYDTNLVMQVFEADGRELTTLTPGQTVTVIDGDFAVVGSRAVAPRASVYGFYDVYYDND